MIATFTFQRTYSFYLIHIYGPSALIVVISWISFLLPHEQAPARVTLGVTSLLTEVTILTMSNQAIPRVRYYYLEKVGAIERHLFNHVSLCHNIGEIIPREYCFDLIRKRWVQSNI